MDETETVTRKEEGNKLFLGRVLDVFVLCFYFFFLSQIHPSEEEWENVRSGERDVPPEGGGNRKKKARSHCTKSKLQAFTS